MAKYHILTVQALHVLSARWRSHVTPADDLLTDLSPVEWLVVHDAELIHHQITAQAIQVIQPYLPESHVNKIFDALVKKRVLDRAGDDTYVYSERTCKYISTVEAALRAYFKTLQLLPSDKADRLAVLMTALIDGTRSGPNAVPTPIFHLAVNSLMPTDNALGQIQQRLVAMLTYRDDLHIAAWTSEGYSPAAIRVATHLFNNIEMQPLARFLENPLFYDEAYVRTGLEELQRAGDVVEIAGSYQLSVKGATRRERVEHLTNDNFDAAFETHLSPESRAAWVDLMTTLIDMGRIMLLSNRPPADNLTATLQLPKT